MKNTITTVALLLFFLHSPISNAQSDFSKQSEELGKVHWYRDYDQAIAAAKKEQKDVLILFQEVPGCSTCRNYGNNVLSSPLMVEAIENEFIPLAIFNNKGGKDREILNKFNEPAWNNPVVRIVSTKGKDVVKRIGGDYSAVTLVNRMEEALKSNGSIVPDYIKLLKQELASVDTGKYKEKVFKMYCFWTGEKQLGKVDGVLSTQSGFMNGEVVKVKYDPTVVDAKYLDDYAKKNSFTPVATGKNYKIASNDVHYYLRHTDYRYLPLTELQQTKINSDLGRRKSGLNYLSPRQQKWLSQIQKSNLKGKELLNTSFEKAWRIKEKEATSQLSSNR